MLRYKAPALGCALISTQQLSILIERPAMQSKLISFCLQAQVQLCSMIFLLSSAAGTVVFNNISIKFFIL